MWQTIGLIITLILIFIGLVGTLVPMLPGIPLIYVSFFVYGIASGWKNYGANAMIFWGIVTGFMIFLDYYAGALGAKKYGASMAGIWGSIIGGILGVIFLGFIGIILGPLLGAVIGELLSGKTQRDAWKSGWGTLIGFLAGSLFKLIVGFIMAGTFLWWLIF
jgi:uncharacterized protein YqgC (DUF456 family)